VVLAERHRITHSVLAISYLGPGRSERVLMNANPRSRPDFATELDPLLTLEELAELAARIKDIGDRTAACQPRVADYLRTVGGSTA